MLFDNTSPMFLSPRLVEDGERRRIMYGLVYLAVGKLSLYGHEIQQPLGVLRQGVVAPLLVS